MKRQFKFRAWDIILGKMIGWNDLHHREGLDIFCDPALEVMQFTGLRDCNKKEIYEGDIIEAPCLWYGLPSVYLQMVEWGTCDEGYGETTGFDSTHFHKSPVIGNIFEHPELLQSQR